MFCVLYKNTVKPGMDEQFRHNWRKITEHLTSRAGSLGSRLHTTTVFGDYVAYAQWPSREAWQNGRAIAEKELATEVKALLDACSSVKVLHELELVDEHRPGQHRSD